MGSAKASTIPLIVRRADWLDICRAHEVVGQIERERDTQPCCAWTRGIEKMHAARGKGVQLTPRA